MSAAYPTPWTFDAEDECEDSPIRAANGEYVLVRDSGVYPPDLETCREIVDAVNERDKLKAECDRLRTAYADLWRAVKRIEADSRLGLGTGLEVASSALHYVHTYASSAIRAAEKKGFAP